MSQAASSGQFKPAKTKITIATVKKTPDVIVTAQYNPKEFGFDQSVGWTAPGPANQTGSQSQGGGGTSTAGSGSKPAKPQGKEANEDGMAQEFTGAQGRTVTVELLFDSAEGGTSVEDNVKSLITLTRVVDPTSPDETLRTPPLCVVTWGTTMPAMRCVVTKLTVKYSMFSSDGAPLRATCTVSLLEAERITKKSAG